MRQMQSEGGEGRVGEDGWNVPCQQHRRLSRHTADMKVHGQPLLRFVACFEKNRANVRTWVKQAAQKQMNADGMRCGNTNLDGLDPRSSHIRCRDNDARIRSVRLRLCSTRPVSLESGVGDDCVGLGRWLSLVLGELWIGGGGYDDSLESRRLQMN